MKMKILQVALLLPMKQQRPANKLRRKLIVSPLPFKFKALDGKLYKLTGQQKAWCDVFLEDGTNATISALEAYKVTNKHLCKIRWGLLTEKEKRKRVVAENTAAQIGRDNLRIPKIKRYINKVLSDAGYTDEVVRLEHFKNIKQDENLSAKNQAIDMYYKTVGKYAPEKIEHGVNEKLEKFLEKQNKRLP